jgi:hypothetical protein
MFYKNRILLVSYDLCNNVAAFAITAIVVQVEKLISTIAAQDTKLIFACGFL